MALIRRIPIEKENSNRNVHKLSEENRALPALSIASGNTLPITRRNVKKTLPAICNKPRNTQKVPKTATHSQTLVEALPLPPNVADIDSNDSEYLEFCSGYVKNIYDHLFEVEQKFQVAPGYLERHPELRANMRQILIQWLVSLQARYKLLQDTLLLTISILDRFLSETRVGIRRSNFQLVGGTCMWVACKYEEMYLPSVNDFVYMCDSAYTAENFQHMEIRVLNTLNFNFSKPLSSHFLRRFSKAGGSDVHTHILAKYLIELSLYSYSLVHCKPSAIAASALLVAGKLTGKVEWDDTLEFYSRYKAEELKCIASELVGIASNVDSNKYLKVTRKKYSSEKTYWVTTLFKQDNLEEKLKNAFTKKPSSNC